MSEKTHQTRDLFYWFIILPAVGLASVERFIREEWAEWKARRR